MADPINLNRFRKARARQEKRVQADANAIRFGLTKAERDIETSRAGKSARDLEAHRRIPDPDRPSGED